MSLQLKKLDLHVHTPASYDFCNKKVTADQIVDQAIKVGLDAIAITDHNTVDFIDKIKESALEKAFVIFPGIEVSCHGGKEGPIHVIGLFDPSFGKDDLQKVVGALGIRGKGEEAFTAKSVNDVVNILREEGGLSVLAHANSTNGALSDIRGNPRINLIQNPKLSAVEATAGDFKKEIGKRLLDYLDGKDPQYKRELPVYKSSDNRSPDDNGHCLESIGSQFTYFKMGELTLESLRQCFEDPGSRIIQDYELDKIMHNHPILLSMTVKGGFLDGERFEFNPGMNSIIGGTGTGKSLAIEFLRFVFDYKPTTNSIYKDHIEKLKKELKLNGEIEVYFRDSSGDEYKLIRRLNDTRDPYSNVPVCTNLSTGKQYDGDISSIFPLLIYSQNEILEITRDSNAQLKLLDNFRNFEGYRKQSNGIEDQLADLDRDLFQAMSDSKNLKRVTKEYKTCEEKLQKINKKISGLDSLGKSDTYLKLFGEKESIEEKIKEYDILIASIDETIELFETNCPPKKASSKKAVDIIEFNLNKSYSNVIKALKKELSNIEGSRNKSEEVLSNWIKKTKYTHVEKGYLENIKLKEKEKELETERKALQKEKSNLKKRIDFAKKASEQFQNIRETRKSILEDLKLIKKNYYDERCKQADLINTKSNNKLNIIIQPGDNKTVYLEMLKKLKVGSQVEKTEIEDIVEKVSPVDLIEYALDENIKKIAKLCNLSELKAGNIIGELTHQNVLESLSMQYKGYPEDRIEINYQKKDENHYPLAELSMGQKADALIMIALGDGEMPVIIDQPEDALDVPSIWADICTRLRISKHARQFIFTTHNSSISVSSDSDQYIVLEADGKNGYIASSGSIDQKVIKDNVVGHLEGGYEAYKLKRKKYGL